MSKLLGELASESVAQSDVRPTGDQEMLDSILVWSGNIL